MVVRLFLGGGASKTTSVSKLVATEFVTLPPNSAVNELVVCHLDSDGSNNQATNLEWKT